MIWLSFKFIISIIIFFCSFLKSLLMIRCTVASSQSSSESCQWAVSNRIPGCSSVVRCSISLSPPRSSCKSADPFSLFDCTCSCYLRVSRVDAFLGVDRNLFGRWTCSWGRGWWTWGVWIWYAYRPIKLYLISMDEGKITLTCSL